MRSRVAAQVTLEPPATAGSEPAPEPTAAVSDFDRRWVWLCVVVGVALRFYRLDHQSLWFDEVLTYVSSATSLDAIWSRPPVDPNVPPLYYALMHFVAPLGRETLLLRVPSALFGALAIPLMFVVTRTWMGSRAGRLAALLLATSPLHIWYSQEARPYALLLTLGLLTAYFAQRVLAEPGRRSSAVGFVLSGSAALWCHPIALPFLGMIALYVVLEAPRSQWRLWLILAAAMALLCAPAAIRLLILPPTVSANRFQVFQPAHLGYLLWAFGTGYSFGPTLLELRMEAMEAVRRNLHLIGPVLVLLCSLLLVGARWARTRGRPVFWGSVAWVALPIAFAALGTMLTPHPFNVRYAILALPGFILLVAAGVASVGPRVRAAALVAILAVSAASLAGYYHDPRYQREDVRAAVRYLNANAAAGDLVVASAAYMTLPLKFYRLRPDVELVGYPGTGGMIETAPSPDQGAELGANFVAPARVSRDLDSLVGGRREVWLFLSRAFHSDPAGHIGRHLESRFEREGRFEAAGVSATHYRLPRPAAPMKGR